MYTTEPNADAMRLVEQQFARLWQKIETEIDTVLRQNPDYDKHINAVREISLGIKCAIEDIHITRTAPIVGSPRREWRSMRFVSELSPNEHHELASRNPGRKIPELTHATYELETEPWRSTSAWRLSSINRTLFTHHDDLSRCRDDPHLMALFSIHGGKEDQVTFGGKPYACASWVRLLVDLAMDHLSIIQQSDVVMDSVRIDAEDYDAINAAFDAIPDFNYAALIVGEARDGTSRITKDLLKPLPVGGKPVRTATEDDVVSNSSLGVGLTAYDREMVESAIRKLDDFPKRQLNLIYSEEAEGRSFIPAMAFPHRFVCPRWELGQGGIGLFVNPCVHHATGCTIELGTASEEQIAIEWETLQVILDRLATILPTDFAMRCLPDEALAFATAGRDLDKDRYNHLFWIRLLVGLSRLSPSPLPEFESFDPSCRVYPCGFEFNDDGSSRTIPLDEQRTDSAKKFLNCAMSKLYSPTFWNHEGKPAYSPPQCLEFQIPDIAVATVTVCKWFLNCRSESIEAVPIGLSKTNTSNSVDDPLPSDTFRSMATGQQKDLFRWLRRHGRVSIDHLHRTFPDWIKKQVQDAAVKKALRGLRDSLEAYGEGWRLELTNDEVWLVMPK